MINLISIFNFFIQLSLSATVPVSVILVLFYFDKGEKITGKQKYYTLVFLLPLYFLPVTKWLGNLLVQCKIVKVNLQSNVYVTSNQTSYGIINYLDIVSYLWVLGVIISLLIVILSYIKLKKQLHTALPVTHSVFLNIYNQSKYKMNIIKDIPLKTSMFVSTPVLIGYKNPTIYLPISDVQTSFLPSIFTHELLHYKRKDLWVKAIMICIVILNWYNPLVYLLSKNLEKYQEFSCDEMVISVLDSNQFKTYGYAILSYAQKSKPLLGSSINNSKIKLERRLINMLNVKNQLKASKLFSSLLAATLALGIATPTVTNAMEISQKDELQNVTQISKEEVLNLDEMSADGILGSIITNKGIMLFSNSDDENTVLPSTSKNDFDNLEATLQRDDEYILAISGIDVTDNN